MSTTPEHLDPIVVAEHAEGLLPPAQAAAVDAHLGSCSTCRELAESLAGVSAQLAAAPAELPVPVEVADRIDRALADEAAGAHVIGRPAGQAAAPEGLLVRLRRRTPVLLAAAATIGAIGFAGYAVSSVVGGDGSDSLADIATSAGDDLDSAPERAETDGDAGADLSDDAAEESTEAFDAEALRDSALAPDDPELVAMIRDIATGSAPASPALTGDCGTTLADELEAPLIGVGSADWLHSDSILVVLETDDPNEVVGWLLPTCDTGVEDTIGGPVAVTLD
jgi:hypothetical protein